MPEERDCTKLQSETARVLQSEESSATQTLLDASAQLSSINEYGGACVDLGKASHDRFVPCMLRVGVGRHVRCRGARRQRIADTRIDLRWDRSLPNVWNIAIAGFANLICRERFNSERRSVESHEFDFERFAVALYVDHDPNVAGFEALRGHRLCQHHRCMFFNHVCSRNGYAVMKRGDCDPLSRIQTLPILAGACL